MTMAVSNETSPATVDTPALKLSNISKSFGSTQAVNDVTIEVQAGEVVGLVGENGAGKSTLLKMLAGLYPPDEGQVEANGSVVSFRGPQDALAAGIGVVHQEQSLLTNLSVAENIAMNALSTKGNAPRFGIYRWRQLNREASETLARVGAEIDPRTIVSKLSFVDRQMVEIAKALRVDEIVHATPLVVLDEPTSVLERHETEILEREIRSLKEVGSVIFVSHRLDEVLRICDRVVVLRQGEVVAYRRADAVTENELFTLMTGQESRATSQHAGERVEADEPVLAVRGLRRKGAFEDVSFSVCPGRCVAIVGPIGSGRESLCRAVFGAEPFDGGTIEIGGKRIRSWSVPEAVRSGVGYVPSERQVEGMVGRLTAVENLMLASPGETRFGPFINSRARGRLAAEWFERLDVRPRDPNLRLDRFSGGNQQKVIMAKWLQADDLKVLLLDHPLRGLDPGAAETVNERIKAACGDGVAVVLLADTLEEALDTGDDVLVMRDGAITARFDLAVDCPTSLDLLKEMG